MAIMGRSVLDKDSLPHVPSIIFREIWGTNAHLTFVKRKPSRPI